MGDKIEIKLWHKIVLSCFLLATTIVVITIVSKASISYDAGSNTIIVVGGNESNPYSFEDIYQADQSNGWNVVKKQGEKEYYLFANLQIGNGVDDTFFKEMQKAIEINGEFEVKGKATAQFGEWDGHAKNGCYIYFAKLHTSLVYYDVRGTLKLYGCILFAKKDGTTQRIYIRAREGATTDYRECIFCDFRGLRFANTDANVQNVKIRNVLYGYYVDSPLAHKWSGVFTDETLSVAYQSGTITIYNLETPRIEIFGSTSTLHLILVDAVNTIKPTIGSSNDECQLIYKYTTTIQVTNREGEPIDNATCKIYDKDGNLVAIGQTNSEGKFSAEITSRRYYGQNETLDIRTPHTIRIERDGYMSAEFNMSIVKTTNIVIPLNTTSNNETKTISLSGSMIIWLIPCMMIFLTAMTRRLILVTIASTFGAFSFLYLAYTTGNFIYAFACIICLVISAVLSYEQLAGGEQ